MTRPLFIFSLPRAGSTLLQRILAGHAEIASAAEPWLLIPALYALRSTGVVAEYGHEIAVRAIRDFCRELEGGEATYLRHVRRQVLDLYAAASPPGTTYFLDKTPRYALLAREIVDLFPDAKIVFLWRNPLAVVASMLERWGRGSSWLYVMKIDLFDGLANLIRVAESCGDRALQVRYEELIAEPEAQLARMLDYLELPAQDGLLDSFAEVTFEGAHGDPTRDQYRSLSDQPLHKWKGTISNPVRKRWCRGYLRWLGPQRLAAMGYDLGELERELAATKSGVRHLAGDVVRIATGAPYARLKESIFRGRHAKIQKRVTGRGEGPRTPGAP
jgi:hypothetical protein